MSSTITINGIQSPVRVETEKTVKFTIELSAEQVKKILLDYVIARSSHFKGADIDIDVGSYGLFRGVTIIELEHESDAE